MWKQQVSPKTWGFPETTRQARCAWAGVVPRGRTSGTSPRPALPQSSGGTHPLAIVGLPAPSPAPR